MGEGCHRGRRALIQVIDLDAARPRNSGNDPPVGGVGSGGSSLVSHRKRSANVVAYGSKQPFGGVTQRLRVARQLRNRHQAPDANDLLVLLDRIVFVREKERWHGSRYRREFDIPGRNRLQVPSASNRSVVEIKGRAVSPQSSDVGRAVGLNQTVPWQAPFATDHPEIEIVRSVGPRDLEGRAATGRKIAGRFDFFAGAQNNGIAPSFFDGSRDRARLDRITRAKAARGNAMVVTCPFVWRRARQARRVGEKVILVVVVPDARASVARRTTRSKFGYCADESAVNDRDVVAARGGSEVNNAANLGFYVREWAPAPSRSISGYVAPFCSL